MQIKLTFDNGRVLVIDVTQDGAPALAADVEEPPPCTASTTREELFGFVNIYQDANGISRHPGYYVHSTDVDADEVADMNMLRTVRVLKQRTAPAVCAQKWAVGTRRSGRMVIDNGRLRHAVRNIIGALYEVRPDQYVFVEA